MIRTGATGSAGAAPAKDAIEQCARILFNARTKNFRLYDIPEPFRPRSITEAYAVQRTLSDLMVSHLGTKRIGIKAANTNPTSQKFLSLQDPFFGPLILSGKSDSDVTGTKSRPVSVHGVSKLWTKICEPEFAFRIGKNGKPVAIAPAIEIVHSCFLNWKLVGAPSLVADMACNGAWVRGEEIPINKVKDLGSCTVYVNGKAVTNGHASKVLGGPDNVMKALDTFLKSEENAMYGGSLKEGDWVSTGVCADPPYHICNVGETIVVEFDGLGDVAMTCEK